ncbi:MAG: hypothetical protein HQM10_00420 [Candidatus Riflebacteria bacterium]|nr:hypothetical protein [Candidatus Riflebacteria bacterium]
MLRNCEHKSEIQTYIKESISGKKIITKVSDSVEGINNLQNEKRGWDWFQSWNLPERKHSICKIIQKKSNFIKLEIDYFKGFVAQLASGYNENSAYIEKIIDFYLKNWPRDRNGCTYFHGDFSLENTVFLENKIIFLDWEHFCEKSLPHGWDLLYLIFESLYYSIRKSMAKPILKDIAIVKKHLKIIFSSCTLLQVCAHAPLSSLIAFMNIQKEIWGKQFCKFPILDFSKEQVYFIDNALRKY